MARQQSDLSDEASARFRRGRRAIFLAAASVLLTILYPATVIEVPDALCPSGTFISGHMGSEIGILGTFLIFPACFVLILCSNAKSPHGARVNSLAGTLIRNHATPFVIIALAALLTSAALWSSYAFSYFCAMPRMLILHRDPLEEGQSFIWDDVWEVRALCWAGSKTPWQGGLNLTLVGGEEIRLALGTRHPMRNYDAIRAALAGKSYRYRADDIGKCPRDVYFLFANWRN